MDYQKIVVPQLRPGGKLSVELLLLPGHRFHKQWKSSAVFRRIQ